jgi:hypothetical protein
MPSRILHVGASVACSHQGRATPTVPDARVSVGGQAVVTIVSPYAVTECSVPPPGSPCATGQWTTGAKRVFAGGQPVVVMAGTSTSTPTSSPLVPMAAQARVLAT